MDGIFPWELRPCKLSPRAVMEPEYLDEWSRAVDRLEVEFVADHGGGHPDVINEPWMSPEDRLAALRRLGFRVKERYIMRGFTDDAEDEHWCRLTNDIAVNLDCGFVSRIRDLTKRKGAGARGGGTNRRKADADPGNTGAGSHHLG